MLGGRPGSRGRGCSPGKGSESIPRRRRSLAGHGPGPPGWGPPAMYIQWERVWYGEERTDQKSDHLQSRDAKRCVGLGRGEQIFIEEGRTGPPGHLPRQDQLLHLHTNNYRLENLHKKKLEKVSHDKSAFFFQLRPSLCDWLRVNEVIIVKYSILFRYITFRNQDITWGLTVPVPIRSRTSDIELSDFIISWRRFNYEHSNLNIKGWTEVFQVFRANITVTLCWAPLTSFSDVWGWYSSLLLQTETNINWKKILVRIAIS